MLCSILAAGVFSFSNNTYAESITDDDGDKTITDTIVNAESVSASNGHTITFEGNDSISLVSVDSATPKMQAQNSSYLKFGSAEQKINNIYIKAKDTHYYTGRVKSGGKIEVNANNYTQEGSIHGITIYGNTDPNIISTLTMNVDKFISKTQATAIHVREGKENTARAYIGSADKPLTLFDATATNNDGGVSLLQVNEGNSIDIYADTVNLVNKSKPDNQIGGGVLGSGTYGTINIDAEDINIDGNISATYGGVNDKDKTLSINLTTDTLNMTGDINIGSKNNQITEGDTTLPSKFSRDTDIRITANKQAVINGDINIKGNEADNKDTSSDKSALTLELNGNSDITGDINVLGVAGETGQDVSINLGGSGDMTGSKGVFNVENGGNVNFTGGKWAVNKWNSTSGDGNISIDSDAAVIVNDNINVSNVTTKSGANIILDGSSNKFSENAAITATNYTVDKDTIITVNNVNTNTVVKPFADKTTNQNIQTKVYSNNIMQDLEYDSNNNQFLVKTADASKVLAGGVLLNIATDITENNKDIPFFNDVLTGGSSASAVQSINALANIGELGGTAHGAYSMSNALTDSVHEHLSKPQHGDESDIWAKYIHTKENIDGVQLGGMTADIDAQYNGIIAGGEFYNKGKASAGMAFMYADGSISGGSGAYTKNDAEYYGASLYGRIDNGDSALIGDISYLHGSNDITQYNAGHTITASPDADAFSLGLRAEQVFDTNAGTFTPYAGLRYMHLGIGDYTDSIGLSYDADEQNLVLLPVGVKYSTEIKNGGWTIRPLAEAGYVWTMGDRDTDQTVRLGSAADSFGFEVADSGSFLGKLGVEFDSDTASYGFGYEYQKGDTVKANRWMANMEFKF